MTVPNNANYRLAPTITIPSALEITSITRSNPAVISVIANSDQVNTYFPGQLVRVNVPYTFGMWQIANQTLKILAVNVNDITLAIDSTGFDPFIVPSVTAEQPATIAPAGSRNLALNNLTSQVPFQSLNNLGN